MAFRGVLGLHLSFLAACAASGAAAQPATSSGTVSVSATVLSKNVCKLSTANALLLDFLTIDPSSTQAQVKQLTWTFSCNGASATAAWSMTAGDGLHAGGVGQRRMRHATVTTEFMPYSLAISPASGTSAKGATVSVTITGTVAPASFQSAIAGAYSDTVAVTVAP